jgi:hypothetical protein
MGYIDTVYKCYDEDGDKHVTISFDAEEMVIDVNGNEFRVNLERNQGITKYISNWVANATGNDMPAKKPRYEEKKWLTTNECAYYLGVSKRTILRYAKRYSMTKQSSYDNQGRKIALYLKSEVEAIDKVGKYRPSMIHQYNFGGQSNA